MSSNQTAIVTGASQGIGAASVEALLNAGYNVVATSRSSISLLAAFSNLVLVAGDIGKKETAAKVVEAAMEKFRGLICSHERRIFSTKPFTEFTTDDFNALVSTNLLGFLYITQLAVEQMLKQPSGAVVSITAALADQPIAGVNAAVPDDHQGRAERSNQESSHRVCQGRDQVQRGSCRNRGRADTQGRSEGFS